MQLQKKSLGRRILDMSALAECVFYILCKVRQHLLEVSGPVPRPHRKLQDVETAFFKGLQTAPAREIIESWCFGQKLEAIPRGNFLQWLAFAFLERELEDVQGADMVYLEKQAAKIEGILDYRFADGFDHKVRSMRTSMDPMRPFHHPLLLYMGTHLGTFTLLWILLSLSITLAAACPPVSHPALRWAAGLLCHHAVHGV
jgi:hypothetical protein